MQKIYRQNRSTCANESLKIKQERPWRPLTLANKVAESTPSLEAITNTIPNVAFDLDRAN